MIKKLMNSIREYKRDSILAPVFVTLEVIMEVIIPWLMAELIDKGIDGENMNFILKLGIMLAIACVVSLIFGALSGKYSASASSGFAKNLRKDMFYNIQNFSFSNIEASKLTASFKVIFLVTQSSTSWASKDNLKSDSSFKMKSLRIMKVYSPNSFLGLASNFSKTSSKVPT